MNNTVHSQTQKSSPKDFPYITFGQFEISAVVLILLAAILTYYFNGRKSRGERHEKSYDIFHDAFIPAIKILNKSSGTFRPDDFVNFQNTFINQDTAMFKIQDGLRGGKLRRFNKKWQEYKEWQQNCETYEFTVMTIGIESNRQKCLALIDELLKIAKKH